LSGAQTQESFLGAAASISTKSQKISRKQKYRKKLKNWDKSYATVTCVLSAELWGNKEKNEIAI
jgi:hypothetical protein